MFPDTMSIRDRNGKTPFHYAAICNDGGQYYELLGQFGADHNLEDSVIFFNANNAFSRMI